MEAQTTSFQTFVNGLNMLSGVGLLSMPFALSQGGWFSLIFFFLVASVCWYTGLLLHRCMEIDREIKIYPDIGGVSFGKYGKLMVSFFVYVELYLIAVEFLIMGGDGLQNVFPNQGFKVGALIINGRTMYMMVTALVIMPTTWLKSLGALAYISFVGILTTFVLIFCVVWAGVVEGVGFQQRGVLFKLEGLPTTLSLFTFCYCAHAVFPTLRTPMRNQAHFSEVLLVCFVLCTINSGSVAILGYLMYGSNICEQVTLCLPKNKINTKIAIFTTLTNPLARYASVMNPISVAIEDAYPLCATRVMSIIIRTLLLLSTLIVALTIPFFAYVMAFVGAFVGVTTSILIPCFCYLKLNVAARRFGWELLFIVFIVAMGFCIAIVGTYSSVRDIIKRL